MHADVDLHFVVVQKEAAAAGKGGMRERGKHKNPGNRVEALIIEE
jgi:hypothetical protein